MLLLLSAFGPFPVGPFALLTPHLILLPFLISHLVTYCNSSFPLARARAYLTLSQQNSNGEKRGGGKAVIFQNYCAKVISCSIYSSQVFSEVFHLHFLQHTSEINLIIALFRGMKSGSISKIAHIASHNGSLCKVMAKSVHIKQRELLLLAPIPEAKHQIWQTEVTAFPSSVFLCVSNEQ